LQPGAIAGLLGFCNVFATKGKPSVRPKVFVSSTFFDLRQVRDDLRSFIEEIGYEPLLSEHPSFPIDPSVTTIENCRRRVEQDADLFVLIVGARYGSRDPDSSRSVTNIEYLAARAKGVPVYAFMEKRLEPLLALWKARPDVDLSSEIDTPDLLRFIDGIRSDDKVWTSSFERASDIIECLRAQFAHLMREALEWRRKVDEHPLNSYVRKLSGPSLRLALERPRGWEFLLLAQVIRDEVDSTRHLREEHEEALALELGEDVAAPIKWAQHRLGELQRLATSLTPIMNSIALRAIGPPGQSGNADEIAFVGRAIGRVYASALNWSRRIRTANLPEALEGVRGILARFTDEVLGEIEEFAERLRRTVREALNAPPGGEPRTVAIVLTLRLSDSLIAQLNAELARLEASGPLDW
jgi:hypothetical protein